MRLGLVAFLAVVCPAVQAETVSILAYNVENLWDAVNDADQGDPTYLPMTIKKTWVGDPCASKKGNRHWYKECRELDWTEEKYLRKLKAAADVILSYNEGRGPDILVMEELENRRVVEDLVERHLGAKGLRHIVHYESPSERGIDVGIVSRIPVDRQARHRVDLSKSPSARATRDILEAEFHFRDERFIVAGNHWPSLNNDVSTRVVAAETLLDQVVGPALKRGIPVVATGDFNSDPTKDLESPITGRIAAPLGEESNLPLVDFLPYTRPSEFYPPATHFYNGKWQPLDRVLVTRDLLDAKNGIHVRKDSFQIYYTDAMVNHDADGKPAEPRRFDYMTMSGGFSDHLPVAIQLDVR